MILGICSSPDVMKVARIINIIITIIKIVVPVILIVVSMITYMSLITSNDADISKANKTLVTRFIAAVCIFFVPTFVRLIVDVIDGNDEYTQCLEKITISDIENAYEGIMDGLVSAAESEQTYDRYNSAKIYLTNIDDEGKRKLYSDRLEAVHEAIKAKEEEAKKGSKEYDSTDYGTADFVYTNRTSEYMGYALYVPEKASGHTLPLIVWLHGSGEVGGGSSGFLHSGLLNVVNNWENTGLANIGAIILAPQLSSGSWSGKGPDVQKLINKIKNEYSINEHKIVLIGHSLGGSGVIQVASASKEYFSAIVELSGYISSPGNDLDYFTNIPMKGFSDSGSRGSMNSFFNKTNHSEDLVALNCSHGKVPKVSMEEDSDGDKISDLVYWMLSQYKE